MDMVLALHAGSRGFDSNRGHMSERFFRSNRPGYPHPVSSELENSGIRVAVGDCSVTERRRWRPPYQTGKTVHVHAKHYKHNEDGHTAPGVCGNGSVPLSHSGNVVTRIGIHTYTNSLRMVEFSPIWLINKVFKRYLRNPGRDISFPIFTRKQIETKRIRKEIKTIISSLNHFLSFLSNILEQKMKQEY